MYKSTLKTIREQCSRIKSRLDSLLPRLEDADEDGRLEDPLVVFRRVIERVGILEEWLDTLSNELPQDNSGGYETLAEMWKDIQKMTPFYTGSSSGTVPQYVQMTDGTSSGTNTATINTDYRSVQGGWTGVPGVSPGMGPNSSGSPSHTHPQGVAGSAERQPEAVVRHGQFPGYGLRPSDVEEDEVSKLDPEGFSNRFEKVRSMSGPRGLRRPGPLEYPLEDEDV